MWLLFFSDLTLPSSPADVMLAGVRVDHLEQADDIVFFSMSPRALQCKLDAFFRWCCENLLQINDAKSWWMPLGRTPPVRPVLTLNGKVVPYEDKKTYVGILLNATARNHLGDHTSAKGDRAHVIGCLIFGVLDQKCLRVPPTVARRLYTALVDPHLTHGADVNPDATKSSTKKIERTQRLYLRKLLRVRENSSIAPLYSETGIAPIRYRRADLAIRMLGYALQQPEDSLVHCALRDSLNLALTGARSWYGDLMKTLELLPKPVHISFRTSVDEVEAARRRLDAAMKDFVADAVASNVKLNLLVGRPNPRRGAEESWGSAPIMELRSYLRVVRIPEHRDALTKLLLSEHDLGVERLRYVDVAHDLRLCRFCLLAVETPAHALFACNGSQELSALRRQFYEDLAAMKEHEGLHSIRILELDKAIQHFACTETTLPMFARFVRGVFRCFDSLPLHVRER
ncbi:hypothetical protein AURDEDRAFT_75611 [Auricularia subglabra TFB-10046 SS5]|nr:hypothetical protein AURDEDRAFT_75611 [Auricularia subglabra TFB-10046 SS5]